MKEKLKKESKSIVLFIEQLSHSYHCFLIVSAFLSNMDEGQTNFTKRKEKKVVYI